jgi:glucose/arabinose dehydrogenase
MDWTSTRRDLLRLAAAGAATGLAGCSGTDREGGPADTDTPTGGAASTPAGTPTATEAETETRTPAAGSPPDAVGLETLATGLEQPLAMAFAPDADRRYVVERRGVVYVHGPDGLRDSPFLDMRDAVVTGSERGLLGLALHPDFAENRRLYVRYSARNREGTPDDYSHTFVLSEFEATADGLGVDRDSERALLEIPEPQGNHNAGDLAFGPDGYLYVAVGDGGSGGDQGMGHVSDWYDALDGGNAQDVTENLLGSILRIDVDGGRDDERGYAIPGDNPLVGRDGLDEHYAWGLRNPWRMAFDGEDLYVGDVGQSRYEEVDLVTRGGNYGWNVKEGTHCFEAESCPDSTPSDVRGGEPLLDPVVEYPHSGDGVSGISVIGGNVYRGSAIPSLVGRYVFGDWGAGGRLFVATPSQGDGLWDASVVQVNPGEALQRLLAFGRDADGELYVLGSGSDGGGLHRIVPAG